MDQRDDISGAAVTEKQPSPQSDEAPMASNFVALDEEPEVSLTEEPTPESAPVADDAAQAEAAQEEAAQAEVEQEDAARPAGLAPGASVASFTIERMLNDAPDERVYLAVRRGDPYAFGTDGGDVPVILIEQPIGSFEALRPLVTLELRHPRLLAPRGILQQDGYDYLALDTLLTSEDEVIPTVSDGARLDPRAALKAGAGVADALGYLHRSKVFHLDVTPEILFLRDGRAFLGGMERATYMPEAEEGSDQANELGARDANALARAMSALAGLPAEPTSDEDALAADLREITANGESETFESAGDVAGACSLALQHTERLLAQLRVDLPPQHIRLVTGTATTVGRVRSENQDASACMIVDVIDDYGRDAPVGLLLVADGMGGEARGELASRIAARLVTAEVARQLVVPSLALPAFLVTSADGGEALDLPTEHSAAQALGRAAAVANGQVRELVRQLGQAAGTTLTAIALVGTRAALAHVGDSRAYLLRHGALHTLTEDHSVLARLQAVDHPLLSDPDVYVPRSMLYRSLGQEDEMAVDSLEFTLTDGDRLLICSDGLWDEVDASELERIFRDSATPTACAQALVALANASGGHDNSTAVVAFVHAVPDEGDDRDIAAPEDVATGARAEND